MFLISLFIFSGAAIVTLLLAKRVEEKKGSQVFVLRAISKGDERFHDLNLKALHYYTISKENFGFWMKKQLPLRAKGLLIKCADLAHEMSDKYLGDIRNSKLLKRNDGLSEFFKNISEIEKGSGEINETLPEEVISGVPILSSSDTEHQVDVTEQKIEAEQAPTVIVREAKPKTMRKKRGRSETVTVPPNSSTPILRSRRTQLPQKKRKMIKVLSQPVENVNW